MGPDLLNILYSGLILLKVTHDVFLDNADDLAVVTTVKTPEMADLLLNQVMIRVNSWMMLELVYTMLTM